MWDYVPPVGDTDLCTELANLMRSMARRRGLYGVTIGETVWEWEKITGRQVGGVPMEDKVREQRQTSWLARVPRVAGLQRTESQRPSPLKRHHQKPQRVYQWREVNP